MRGYWRLCNLFKRDPSLGSSLSLSTRILDHVTGEPTVSAQTTAGKGAGLTVGTLRRIEDLEAIGGDWDAMVRAMPRPVRSCCTPGWSSGGGFTGTVI